LWAQKVYKEAIFSKKTDLDLWYPRIVSIDVERARRETPGCANVLHFNNAGAALMPQSVLDAVIDHLRLESQIGGYEAAQLAEQKWEHTYDAIALLLGCKRDEIAIVENATRAWDMAFYSLSFKQGDRILTGMAEYASNYIAYLQIAQKTGARIDVIPNDEYGQVSVEDLKNSIDEHVKLIAITHVPTNGGLVNPAAAIGRIAREAGVLYLLDACQSIGQMPIHVTGIGCDILSATGRKYLRGPRGTGFLFVRNDVLKTLEPVFLDLHSAHWTEKGRYQIRPDARRFENWESNYAGKIGLGVAVDYALQWGMKDIRDRVYALGELFRSRLSGLKGVTVRDLGAERCGIVTFTMEGQTPEEIKRILATHRINVSVSPQAYTRLDMEARDLKSVVRASVHYYNTEDEINRFCSVFSAMW